MPARLFAALTLAVALLAPAAAFDRSDWQEFTRSTGTTFFNCKAARCGVGTLASFHAQPAGSFRTLAEFQRNQEQNFSQQQHILGAQTTPTSVQDSSTRKAQLFTLRASQKSREGKVQLLFNGYLDSDGSAHSLVVTANDRPHAEAAYRLLVEHVRALHHGI